LNNIMPILNRIYETRKSAQHHCGDDQMHKTNKKLNVFVQCTVPFKILVKLLLLVISDGKC